MTSTITQKLNAALDVDAIAAARRAKDAERKRAARAAAKQAAAAKPAPEQETVATPAPAVEQPAPVAEQPAKPKRQKRATSPVEAQPAPVASTPAPEPAAAPVEPVVDTRPVSAVADPRFKSDVVGRALAAGTSEIMGAVTFWSLHNVRVRRDDLRATLDRLGLSFANPKDPAPRAVLRMAIAAVSRITTLKVVFDRVVDSKTETVFAMSRRETDENAEIANYRHKTRVRLDKATGALTLEDSTDEVLQAVKARYDEITEYITATEFGIVLVHALRGRGGNIGMAAVNLRGEAGGVYFVPAANVSRLSELADVLDDVGGKGAITVWPIPQGDRAMAQAVEAARVDFVERVKTVRAEVNALLDDLGADEQVDPNGRRVLARARAFAGIKARAEAYSEILGEMRATLDAEVAGVRATLEQRIGAVLTDDFGADDDDDEQGEPDLAAA